MNKHKLLRDDILPAMATNRKVQRLLNEFLDLLSEYESAEQKTQKCLSPAAEDQMETAPATMKDTVESMGPEETKSPGANSAPPKRDRVDLNSPFPEDTDLLPQENDTGS